MKLGFFRVSAATAVLAVFAASAFAQKASDKYLISAKAGGVNEVVGDVTIERSGGRVGRLFKGDEVQVGEKVSTGADGKAEVLMNPGSYVRLGASSSFEFESTDLDDVRIKMHSGSAMLEVFGAEDFDVSLAAGSSRFTLMETGIYRIDVAANGNATVSVVKGKVLTGDASEKPVGKGKRAQFAGNDYLVAKFDRGEKDELALWSSERAKTLSKLSASLRRDTLRDPLISSFWGGRWNLYNTFGLWVYNPFYRSHCFLPFGWGWYSPYGHSFGRPIWNYGLPTAIFRQPPPPSYQGYPRTNPTNPTTRTKVGPGASPTETGRRETRTRDFMTNNPVSAPRESRSITPSSDSSPAETRRTVRIESKRP